MVTLCSNSDSPYQGVTFRAKADPCPMNAAGNHVVEVANNRITPIRVHATAPQPKPKRVVFRAPRFFCVLEVDPGKVEQEDGALDRGPDAPGDQRITTNFRFWDKPDLCRPKKLTGRASITYILPVT